MDEIPWDIDGNRIITVSCNADFWIDLLKMGDGGELCKAVART